MEVTLALAFFGGLLSFVSPCVLPLVPAYVGYMGSRATRNIALEKAKNDGSDITTASPNRASMFIHGIAFMFGFTVVFIAVGLMVSGFAFILGTLFQDILARVGGVVIVIFGLHFMGLLRKLFTYLRKNDALISSITTSIVVASVGAVLILWGFIELFISLPILAGWILLLVLGGAFNDPKTFWTTVLERIEIMLYSDTRPDMDVKESSGLGGSFFMGVVFSAGWTPCVGPIFGAILAMSQEGDFLSAATMLFAYSLGLGIPFLLAAIALDGAQGILRRLQKHMHTLELISGAFLIFIGVMVASGQMQRLVNATSTQTELAGRIEHCGLDFVDGQLAFGQLGACFSGDLVPLQFNQSRGVFFNDDFTEVTYLVNVDENDPQLVNVEFQSLDETFDFNVTFADNDGNILASSTTLEQYDNRRYYVLRDIPVEVGKYQVTVTNTSGEDIDFRFKVTEANRDDTSDTATANDNESPVSALAGLGISSIEDVASSNDITIGLEVGNRAPNFTITTIEGEAISLSDLRGQVVLLNFWGTWCAPCIREMPEFQHAYEEYNEQGFEILALAVRDNETDVLEFREEYGLTFPLALDEGNRVSDDYRITRQPSTLMLDQDGVIVFKNFGLVVESQISAVLAEHLPQGE